MRLSVRSQLLIAAAATMLGVVAAAISLPATSLANDDMRLWLTARASGLVAYGLLTAQVSFGILLSHPTNVSTWKLSKRVFPWHENLSAFLLAFIVVHVVAIVLDPYAAVSPVAVFVPGLAGYRPIPVAIGSLALYAALVAAVSARWTRLLPAGMWLRLHRLALVAWVGGWVHGVFAGTDVGGLVPWYVASGVVVTLAAASRYWAVRVARRAAARVPTPARAQPPAIPRSLPEVSR